jgi:hypothetical protein
MDEWINELVSELKRVSTTNWGGGNEAFTAMPATIQARDQKAFRGDRSQAVPIILRESQIARRQIEGILTQRH